MPAVVIVGVALVLVLYRPTTSAEPAPIHLPEPVMPTQTQRRDFVRTWFEAINATSALQRLSLEARRLALAHAAYESGFGTAFAAKTCTNPWNITAGSWWMGQGRPVFVQENADDDYRPDGTKVRITQTWRRYGSKTEAVADYAEFLTSQNGARYRQAWAALERGDVDAFARELRSAGYFTFPLAAYAANLKTVLDAVTRELT